MPLAPFVIGDWVSDFSLQSDAGKTVKLSDTVGVPVVLLFFGEDPTQAAVADDARAGLSKYAADFAERKTIVLAISRGPLGQDLLDGPPPTDSLTGGNAMPSTEPSQVPLLFDVNGELTSRYSAARLRAVLLSPNARVTRFYDAFDPAALAPQVLADVDAIVNLEPPRAILQQAPMMLIPDVVPPEFCKKLIDIWGTQGNQDSGFMVNEGDRTVGKFDYNAKIRRDHFIPRGNDVDKEARSWIARHIVPEVFKAFNYEVTRLEDMKIACYDAARGGYFRPHRDNTTGATAHRRFAVSILLNDDYDGGYLRFPEYGPHLYRPKAGGAAVFGCSLLHEATDVTAGRRFVLLTFMYGEKEAKIREEYAKRTGGDYRAK